MPRIVAVDFETLSILPRPDYPPEPVSAAIQWPGEKQKFLSWGHPSGNNTTYDRALGAIARLWERAQAGEIELLFHHAKFDLAVAEEKLGLPSLPWQAVHDTQFLGFLADPHAKGLGLKGLAEEWLDWPPEEQDAVAEWVWEHRKELVATYGGKITRAKRGPNSAGAWIGRCPADIVEPYALGDVARTYALFEYLYPVIERWGMIEAYDRERRVLPIFMENEAAGLRIDLERLDHDINLYERCMVLVEHWLRGRLRAHGLNFDADEQVAEALERAGVVDPDAWVYTAPTKTHPRGQRSVSKDNLHPGMFNDPKVASALGYRNRLKTCLSTFMRPWAEQAQRCSGRIHTTWNQVQGEFGTRTGRPSTTKPNILNIPKTWDGRGDGYQHPGHIKKISPLPLVRKYILPEEGHVWLHRDFSSQELRVFADYERGSLFRAYLDNPELDPHNWVRDVVEELVDIEMDRTKVKTLNFQAIYGGGIPAAAKKLACSRAQAQQYKQFHDQALPGRRLLNEEITRLVRRGDPVCTLGGRVYFCERPKVIQGRRQSFEYKLINYLCQGSAADCTKEVLANWNEAAGRDALFRTTVYDEINISADVDKAREQMELLRDIMEDVKMVDVPMLTEGKWGPSWGDLADWENEE